jgi:hypothetical protein
MRSGVRLSPSVSTSASRTCSSSNLSRSASALVRSAAPWPPKVPRSCESDRERQQREIRTHQACKQREDFEVGPHDAPRLHGGDHAQERMSGSALGHGETLIPPCVQDGEIRRYSRGAYSSPTTAASDVAPITAQGPALLPPRLFSSPSRPCRLAARLTGWLGFPFACASLLHRARGPGACSGRRQRKRPARTGARILRASHM